MIDRPLVIYHKNCADGFGAAFAAWMRMGDTADYLPMYHDEQPPDVTGRLVYLVDFSFKRPVLLALREKAHRLIVIDHHKSAQEDLAGLDDTVFDMNHSGAVLAWEFFHTGPAPELLRYVEDRDLWRWALPESKEVAAALWAVPYDFAAWAQVEVSVLKARGAAVLAYMDSQAKMMAKNARKIMLRVPERGAYRVPVANATSLFSEVGEALAEGNPDCPFSLYWFQRTDGQYQYGLRSRGASAFDVSQIAVAFGGGGHAKAAGFQLPYLLPCIAEGKAA